MKFTDLFIQRPVLAIVVTLALLLGGWVALQKVGVRQYPKLNAAVINVRTVYPGANAETIRGFVTAPLERALASVDGLDYIDAQSFGGYSAINLRLRLNADGNAALAQVVARVSEVRSQLPPATEPPVVNLERTDSRFASAYLGFQSSRQDLAAVTDYLTRHLQPELLAVPGVQRADLIGRRTYAMRVWLDPDRLRQHNIAPGEIWQALEAQNWLAAPGETRSATQVVSLAANTDRQSAEDFAQLVVATRGGTPLRLSDVARVELGAQSTDDVARYRGQEAVFIGIWVLPSANQLTVLHDVAKKLEELKPRLPEGLSAEVVYDSSRYVEKALHEIQVTLKETVLIVGVVVFLFLGTVRSALVPLVAIPVSLVGAGLFLAGLGFSVNLLTLLAIVLAVGLVVDDAIVIVENVQRLIQEGKTPIEAALHGARQLAGPVIAMTITLAAVYAPIGLQGGLTGMLFREFAFSLAGAVIVSGVVALTLSPLLSARLLQAKAKPSWLGRWSTTLFQRLQAAYAKSLDVALVHRTAVILVGLAVLTAVPFFYQFSGRELAPREDQDEVNVMAATPPGVSPEYAKAYAQQVSERLAALPEADYAYEIVSGNFFFAGLVTQPAHERSRTTLQLLEPVGAGVQQVSGFEAFPMLPAPLPGAGDYDVEVLLMGGRPPEEMAYLAAQMVERLKQTGYFLFVDTDLKLDRPEARLEFDFDQMAALGLDARAVASDVAVLTSGAYVNRFEMAGRSFQVIPMVEAASRTMPEQLLDLPVRGPEGKLIPLGAIARIEATTATRLLPTFQQRGAARLVAVNLPGVTQGAALEAIAAVAQEILPPDVGLDYAGESRQFRQEAGDSVTLLLLSVLLVYLVLAAQFQSFRDPLVVLLGSVPLALGGALLITYLGGTTLIIYSQVGLVTLVGLIAKNGILVVEFDGELQEAGKSKLAALREAAVVRFRPILITSCATVFGHLPLVFVSGPGAAARNSIGLVLVAGMVVGTVLALYVVPAMYLWLARDHHRHARPPSAVPSSAAVVTAMVPPVAAILPAAATPAALPDASADPSPAFLSHPRERSTAPSSQA